MYKRQGPDATPEMTNNLIETLDQMRMRFASAMNDDFNAPLALSVLFDLGTETNRWIDKGIAAREALEQADNIFRELGGDVLGIVPAVDSASGSNGQREAGLIQILIDLRNQARKSKNFAESDRIRDELAKVGVTLEDRADGTIWRTN